MTRLSDDDDDDDGASIKISTMYGAAAAVSCANARRHSVVMATRTVSLMDRGEDDSIVEPPEGCRGCSSSDDGPLLPPASTTTAMRSGRRDGRGTRDGGRLDATASSSALN